MHGKVKINGFLQVKKLHSVGWFGIGLYDNLWENVIVFWLSPTSKTFANEISSQRDELRGAICMYNHYFWFNKNNTNEMAGQTLY